MDPNKSIKNRRTFGISYSQNVAGTGPYKWTETFRVGFNPDVAIIRCGATRIASPAGGNSANIVYGLTTSLEPTAEVSYIVVSAGLSQYAHPIDVSKIAVNNQTIDFEIKMMGLNTVTGGRSVWLPVQTAAAGGGGATPTNYFNCSFMIEFVEYSK